MKSSLYMWYRRGTSVHTEVMRSVFWLNAMISTPKMKSCGGLKWERGLFGDCMYYAHNATAVHSYNEYKYDLFHAMWVTRCENWACLHLQGTNSEVCQNRRHHVRQCNQLWLCPLSCLSLLFCHCVIPHIIVRSHPTVVKTLLQH